ncbi:alcohol dehydrogenase [Streptomyces subrutilus]|uniref:Alcohol dehydrogenase n=1 Tax=Streptomyces subrutilus TaxID=36818 RepID=A0A5P2UIY4_9ACTN|nr:NAD(P)-dependent alcohol dehydrogenase [Streptomyces subrutilus]QEU77444.1 NAD(P)-dependent alcohol dehydrogenase [Streptomyces subrutilus]GGZ47503.1 alcohol dehydrogenase [Streptomyces subrutilus]
MTAAPSATVAARAAVLRSRTLPFRVEDVVLDGPGTGEVLVRVAGTGLCHTDLLPRTDRLAIALPLIAGHEGAGTVLATGTGVTGVAAGDHVVMSFDSCGTCRACLAARPANCSTFFPRNLTGRRPDGTGTARDAGGGEVSAHWFGQSSFATHAVVPARALVPVSGELPLDLLGPLGCGFQTGAGAIVNSLAVRAGSSVVVAGTGAVGLAAVMAARAVGATVIVAVDVRPARRKLAEELGATHTLDGHADGLTEEILEITGGADHAVDTTGLPPVITALVRSLHSHGSCGLVGVQHGDLTVDPLLIAAGRTVKGIIEGDAVPRLFVPHLITLWQQGRFPFDRLVRRYPLDEIDRAERDVASGEVVKAVLIPS